MPETKINLLKGCIQHIFAVLIFNPERENFENKCFLFPFKSSLCSSDIQMLEFWELKFHDLIEFQSILLNNL